MFCRFSIPLLYLVLFSAGLAYAGLEWQLEKPLELRQNPRNTVTSPDGKRIFVLGDQGIVEVYDNQGRLETEIKVPFKVDTMESSSDGTRLYLSEKGKKQLQVLSLKERFQIPLKASPFKGPADAAVSVVVFSDFQ